VVGWLYEGADSRIPTTARDLLSSGEARISPIVELELTYLYEVGRVSEPAAAPLEALQRSIGLTVSDVSTAGLVDAAAGLSWTRDPFDRLIAAHATVADVPLITADRTILVNLRQAVWN
jgi:PIN domain nuclease of toxin-antitoxin system